MIDRVNNQKIYDYAKVNQQKRESTEAPEFHLNMGKEGVIYEQGQQKKASKPKEAAMGQEGQEGSAGAASAGVKVEISSKGYEKSARERQRASLVEQVQKYAAIAVDFLKTVWDRIWNDHPKTEPGFPEILEEKLAGEEAGSEETGLAAGSAGEGFPGAGAASGSGDSLGAAGLAASGSGDSFGAAGLAASIAKGRFGAGELPAWPAGRLSGRLPDRLADSIYTQEEIRQLFRRGNQKEIEAFLSNNGEKHLARNTELLTQYDKKGSIVGINSYDRDLILHGNRNQIKL